jgi:hypothetical protein
MNEFQQITALEKDRVKTLDRGKTLDCEIDYFRLFIRNNNMNKYELMLQLIEYLNTSQRIIKTCNGNTL